jgi:hypothetical protein
VLVALVVQVWDGIPCIGGPVLMEPSPDAGPLVSPVLIEVGAVVRCSVPVYGALEGPY